MSYLVLARKYRPRTFAELVGQEHVVKTLSNAIGEGRLAHAFLFVGPRGIGKTSTSRFPPSTNLFPIVYLLSTNSIPLPASCSSLSTP